MNNGEKMKSNSSSSVSKLGGGGKMQAYVPKGNGEKSGQYVSTHRILHYVRPNGKKPKLNTQHSDDWPNCGGRRIENEVGKYNFANAKIKKVVIVNEIHAHVSLESISEPNSVAKKIVDGCVVTERYYDELGEAYLDIDYSNHYDSIGHPKVPHFHTLHVNKDGKLIRTKLEDE